jgi:hypothetical protein
MRWMPTRAGPIPARIICPNNPNVRIAKMTTATINAPSVKLIPVVVYWKGDNIAITAGTQTCKIDQTHFDDVSFSDDATEEYKRLAKERNGRTEFTSAMTRDQMLLWCEIRKVFAEYKPEVKEESKPAPVIVEPVKEEKPATAVAPLPSLANHTAAVTIPEGGEEYIGGPTVRKKRQRKTDERMGAIAKAVTERMRVVSFSSMERRILQLEKAREFFNDDIEELQYDIPSLIRAEIPEPTRVIRSVGGVMVTESCALVKTKDMPLLAGYFEILDEYAEGTPNAERLGCHSYYDHIEVSFKSREKLKGRVSRVADILLRSAHTSLINAIGKADDDLKKAMGEENKTLKDMERAQCGRDNAYRAAIRTAAEKLNVALMHCEAYDTKMETKDLFKATYAAIASIKESFNAETAKRGADGVTI